MYVCMHHACYMATFECCWHTSGMGHSWLLLLLSMNKTNFFLFFLDTTQLRRGGLSWRSNVCGRVQERSKAWIWWEPLCMCHSDPRETDPHPCADMVRAVVLCVKHILWCYCFTAALKCCWHSSGMGHSWMLLLLSMNETNFLLLWYKKGHESKGSQCMHMWSICEGWVSRDILRHIIIIMYIYIYIIHTYIHIP